MKDVWQSIGTTIAAVSYKSAYPQYKRISVKNVKEETRKMKRLNKEEVKNYRHRILREKPNPILAGLWDIAWFNSS